MTFAARPIPYVASSPAPPSPMNTGWLNSNDWYTIETDGNFVAFSNERRVEESDNSYATVSLPNNKTAVVVGFDFGMEIPAGSTIDGIECRAEVKCSANTSSVIIDVDLVRNASWFFYGDWAENFGRWESVTTTDTYYKFGNTTGGPAGTWGHFTTDGGDTYTDPIDIDDINSSGIGVYVEISNYSGSSKTFSVDNVQICVYYTPP